MRRKLLIIAFTFLGALAAFFIGVLAAEWKIRSAKPVEILPNSSGLNSVSQTETAIKLSQNGKGAVAEESTKNFADTINSGQPEENNLTENKESYFSFAVIGDTQGFSPGNANGSFQKAAANIKKNNASLIFAVGDLISSCDEKTSCESKYNSWRSVWGGWISKIYAIQGNHDRTERETSDAMWQKVFSLPTNGPAGFSELTYSFNFDNSHFVVLDSDKPNENKINAVQRDWLERDLSANKKENTFVFYHEPAYPVSSKIGESLDVHSQDRNALWDILTRHKVTAVFSGHEHIHSRKKINGLYQFIIGNTDVFNHEAPKSGLAEYSYVGHHFAIAEVNGNQITVKIYSVDGNLLNTFSF